MISTHRKMLQRSGKDHSILLVLPSGIYHYKFIVDGEQRYIPDLPFVADETGHVCNLLDVHVSRALIFSYFLKSWKMVDWHAKSIRRKLKSIEF